MTPKASFVIPVYNGTAYLAETLASCLAQTVKNIEVVVVDDGSTDSTRTVIDYYKFRDERVKPVFLETNQGRSKARNAGIQAAASDILLMLDADDIALPHRVRHTIDFFKKSAADVMYSRFQIMDALGNIAGVADAFPFDFEKVKRDKLTYIGHSTMAFRKPVFDKVQYTDGDYSKHAIDDWKFQVDAHKAGFKFGALSKVLSKYRWLPKQRDEKKILQLKEACLN